MSKSDRILDELRKIAKQHRGLVRPVHVVEAAKSPTSPLHGEFVWDNRKAAHEYRLWQARELIGRFWITEPASNEDIRLFLSLTSDRSTKAGYRFSEKVLSDPEQRAEWLAMAIEELASWQRTYGALTELRPAFVAIQRLVLKYRPPEAATG